MKIIQKTTALSSVLAVLLLISVAVGSALITQMWISSYVNNTMSKVEHVIWIPSVDFTDNGSTIAMTIYVQNIYEGTVQLTTVYVNNAIVSTESITMSENGFIEKTSGQEPSLA